MPPPGLLVHGVLRDRTQRPDCLAVHTDAAGRNSRPWRFIHEWHELVGEAGHSASDADAAYVGATANSSHPSTFGDIAVHYGSPASEFHNALRRTVHLSEIALLVVTGSVTTVVHGGTEEPGRTQLVIQRNHRSQTRDLIEEVQHRLHKVVGLHRTSGNIHDRQSSL